ncbi:MAG: hypothetical protein NXI16_11775 [Alphaproteobacteria bacterium]|nr:hypothetical protein [Alphaproteobacteria bacterium]
MTVDVHRAGDWDRLASSAASENWHRMTSRFLTDEGIVAARIRRMDRNDDGLPIVERQETAAVTDNGATVPPFIHDARRCADYRDFFDLSARYCMHRLFDEWLREKEVAVGECLVSERLIERLMDGGTQVGTTVLRIAAMQQTPGEKPMKRRDALLAMIDHMKQSASFLGHHLGETSIDTPAACVDRITEERAAHGDDPRYRHIVEAVIGHFLSTYRSRLAKLEALTDLFALCRDRPEAAIVDGFIADLMVDDEIIQELSGPQPFTIEKLIWIAAAVVIDGDAPKVAALSPYPFATRAVDWVQEGALPETRKAVILALADLVGTTERFADLSDTREKAAILDLLRMLSSARLFIGGPRLARRLTARYARFEAVGGRAGFMEAVQTLTLDLGDLDKQVRYLAAILWGTTDDKLQAVTFREVDRCLRLYGGLDSLAKETGTALHAPEADSPWQIWDGLCFVLGNIAPGPKSELQWLQLVVETILAPSEGASLLGMRDAEKLVRGGDLDGVPLPHLADAVRRALTS